jgi:hypothetical protein
MKPAHLKPLKHEIGNLPNQVNQELDISEMEIITDLVALSGFVKDRTKNDRVKADLTIEAIKKKPEIITYFKDSKSLSGFIEKLNFKSSFNLTYLVKAIIEMKSEIITDLKDSEALFGFIKDLDIKDLDIKDDIDNCRNKTALVKTVIEKKLGIINDLKDSEALSGFIKDLGITTDQYRADLAIEIIEKKPEIITDLKIIPDSADSKSLSGFIKNLGIKTNCDKTDLTIAIIKNNLEILGNDNKEEKLSYIIKSINLDYFPKSILKILKTLPQELISFVKLNNNLYPKSDHLKKDLIIEAIEQGVLDQNNFLKCGFDDLENKSLHLKILEKAKEKGIVVTILQPSPSSILSVTEPSVPSSTSSILSFTEPSVPPSPCLSSAVTVSSTAPSNSPSPGGCFQAFLKCFGLGR